MKTLKSLAVSALVCLTFSLNSSAQDTTAVKKDNPNAPEIAFESDVHDYGTIKQGAEGSCEFKFKNTGKEPLIISNAKASCGCTVPSYPKEPIMKGQTGTIKVTFNSAGKMGVQDKTVTLTSNAKQNPIVLHMKGTVEKAADPTKK